MNFLVIAPTGESEIFCDKNLLDIDINKKELYLTMTKLSEAVEEYLRFYSATDEKHDAERV